MANLKIIAFEKRYPSMWTFQGCTGACATLVHSSRMYKDLVHKLIGHSIQEKKQPFQSLIQMKFSLLFVFAAAGSTLSVLATSETQRKRHIQARDPRIDLERLVIRNGM